MEIYEEERHLDLEDKICFFLINVRVLKWIQPLIWKQKDEHIFILSKYTAWSLGSILKQNSAYLDHKNL